LEREKGGKDRTSEQEKSTHVTHETIEMVKKVIKRRTLLFALISAVLIFTISYVYYMDFIKENSTESAETEAQGKSIAVLPIKNWSGDPELEYISDGITDAVITRLTKIDRKIDVIPFTSVLKYKTSDQSAPVIANELGVQNILQGNFQLSGDQMKITLQLIDGPSNKHFWSEEYSGDWNSNDIFKIQAEVAENIAENLHVELKEEDLMAIQLVPTQNKEAYNLLLQANYQASKYNKTGMENAVPLYEKAIRLDSTFFDAYVNLAYLYLWGGASWGLYNEQEAWHKAKQLLLKANAIDSTNIILKSALNDGSYLYEWDFERMEREYKTRSNIAILYGLQTGKYDESFARINRQLKESPIGSYPYIFKAQALFFLNRKEETTNLLKSIDKLFNDDIMYLRIATRYYFYLEEYENSKVLLNKILTSFSDRPPIVLWLSALHAHRDGNTENLHGYLNDLRNRYEAGESGSPAWFLALYYSIIGEYDEAFEWLQKSYDRHEVEMIWLREEPALIPLRNDKRYLDLYTKVGFPMEPHSLPE
jgi:TolB-like protein